MKLRIRNPQPGQHNVRCPKCQSVQTYVYEAANGEGENTETRPVEKVNKTKPVQKISISVVDASCRNADISAPTVF